MPIPKEEFEFIVRTHRAMLYSIAFNFFHNPGIAEEVAQDVFLQLFENRYAMESNDHMKAWLRRAATHRCIDLLRKRSYRNEEQRSELPDIAEDAETSDPLLEEHLGRLVAALPETQRAVIVLRYGEDMSSMEIGELLNMPAVTVRSHLQRALASLRETAPQVLGRVFHGSI